MLEFLSRIVWRRWWSSRERSAPKREFRRKPWDSLDYCDVWLQLHWHIRMGSLDPMKNVDCHWVNYSFEKTIFKQRIDRQHSSQLRKEKRFSLSRVIWQDYQPFIVHIDGCLQANRRPLRWTGSIANFVDICIFMFVAFFSVDFDANDSNEVKMLPNGHRW